MQRTAWHLFDSGSNHPFINMAWDEALLFHASSSDLVLRLYAWEPPGLSLGYFQKFREMTESFDAPKIGAVITRRITGGDAILHINELTFSLTGADGAPPFDGTVESSYRRIHEAVALGLEEVGVTSCLREADGAAAGIPDPAGRCFYRVTSFDLVSGGRKLVGSAQRRTQGRVLHHGSIPLKPNPMTPGAADCTTLASRVVSYPEAARVLKHGFEETFGVCLEPWEPEPFLLEKSVNLAEAKYGAKAWIQRC